MRFTSLACAASVTLLLIGCTTPSTDGIEASSAPPPMSPNEAVVVPTPTEPAVTPSPSEVGTIPSDPELVATMECEPLSQNLLAKMRMDFGNPTASVQVEVGEGLTPGETWWVVILDSPADDAYQWEELRRFLTNAPGISDEGQWIPVPSTGDPWGSVEWDSERLMKAESALMKAHECLDR